MLLFKDWAAVSREPGSTNDKQAIMGERRSHWAPALGLAALLSLAGAATAQAQASSTPSIAHKIRALGTALDPATIAATAALYAPLHQEPPYPGVRVHRDLSYGLDPDNRLDVFAPEPPPHGALPVLIFVHGGGFVAGDKTKPGIPFYDNVGVWAATHGLVGITVDYRIAPRHPWPAATKDIGAVIRWAFRNAAPFGGDPEKIFVMGHSAGATHIADYISHPSLQPPGGAGIAGAILLSGLYDLTAVQLASTAKAYFGEDPAHYAGQSSMHGLIKTKLPILTVVAEFDPPETVQQANRLNQLACKAHRCLRSLVLPKHNHMSEVYSINTADTRLTKTILDFIKKN